MKNPAEEIVTAWLRECMGFFTMNNVKVPRKGGGMGAEIDILATRCGQIYEVVRKLRDRD